MLCYCLLVSMLQDSLFDSLPNATKDNNNHGKRKKTKAKAFIKCSLFNIKIKNSTASTASLLHLWRGLVSFYNGANTDVPNEFSMLSQGNQRYRVTENVYTNKTCQTLSCYTSVLFTWYVLLRLLPSKHDNVRAFTEWA